MSPFLLGLAARQVAGGLILWPSWHSSALISGLLSNLIGDAAQAPNRGRARCFQFIERVFNVPFVGVFSMFEACFQCSSATLTVNIGR